MRRTRKNSGSSIVETAAGLIIVIPVVLTLIDVSAMVLAQTENDKFAKACTRAAAEYPQGDAGVATAIASVVTGQVSSSLMQNPTCGSPTYSTDGTQTVTCTTTIKCNLPVPIPFGGPSFVNFIARDTEPVVGVLPQ